MHLTIDPQIRANFPGLATRLFSIKEVQVKEKENILEQFKVEAVTKARASYKLETLKDLPMLRAYRDFFWKVGIDPTKTRPASEALLRRVIQGKELPRINTLVDAYNIASMETHVPLAVFDASRLTDDLRMRMAMSGEKFLGIGMSMEEYLTGKEVVIEDSERLVAIYPHHDADFSKVTLHTKDVVVLVCGVPGITNDQLEISKTKASNYIMKFCGGIL